MGSCTYVSLEQASYCLLMAHPTPKYHHVQLAKVKVCLLSIVCANYPVDVEGYCSSSVVQIARLYRRLTQLLHFCSYIGMVALRR